MVWEVTTFEVCIVEDQPKIREGLRVLIDGTDGYRCAGTFKNQRENRSGMLAFRKLEFVDESLPARAVMGESVSYIHT
jgi:hypothetical protein